MTSSRRREHRWLRYYAERKARGRERPHLRALPPHSHRSFNPTTVEPIRFMVECRLEEYPINQRFAGGERHAQERGCQRRQRSAKPEPVASHEVRQPRLRRRQTGRHPVTGEVGRDVRDQTRNILERIKAILAAAGTSLDNVLTATTHLTRVQDLAAYNEEYAKYFPTNKPARTTVTVAALNAPELLIEITVTACIPS
jgi:enamine deaminase RidA (YjgF/YER057c/UK114 family)